MQITFIIRTGGILVGKELSRFGKRLSSIPNHWFPGPHGEDPLRLYLPCAKYLGRDRPYQVLGLVKCEAMVPLHQPARRAWPVVLSIMEAHKVTAPYAVKSCFELQVSIRAPFPPKCRLAVSEASKCVGTNCFRGGEIYLAGLQSRTPRLVLSHSKFPPN